MSLTRRIGLGITFSVDITGNSGNFVSLAAVVDGIKDSGVKAEVIDCGILSDTYVQTGKGQLKAGEKSFMIAWDPNDNTNTNTGQTITGLLSTTGAPGTESNFKIFYPAAGATANSSEYFKGWVTGFGIERQKDKFLTAQVTVTVSGTPGYAGA